MIVFESELKKNEDKAVEEEANKADKEKNEEVKDRPLNVMLSNDRSTSLFGCNFTGPDQTEADKLSIKLKVDLP